jgi:hypothetical protein
MVKVEADPVIVAEFFPEQPDPFAIGRDGEGDAVARGPEYPFAVAVRERR